MREEPGNLENWINRNRVAVLADKLKTFWYLLGMTEKKNLSAFVTDTVMKNANEIYDVKRFPKSPARVVHSRAVLLQRALQGPAFTAFHPSQSQIQSQMPRLSWPQKGFAVSNTPKKEYSEIVSRVTALLGENPNRKAVVGKRNSFCDWEAFVVLSSQ